MNKFNFAEIKLGSTASFTYELNQAKLDSFRALTGDINPLHNDASFAKSHGHPEKVVYGMLTAAALSTLAGVYLPGERSLIHSVEIDFKKPVYLSRCPLTVSGEVTDKDERFQRITLKFTITDNTATKVARGTMAIGFLEDERGANKWQSPRSTF